MSQATTEPTTPTTGDVLARVGETLAALQDAEKTCVEAARQLYEHTQDGNAHGAGLQENIGREVPRPVWQGTALAFQKADGTTVAEAVDLKGQKGDRGEAGPRPEHRWDGTCLTVQAADGSWPENGVDLKGQKGDRGDIGPRPEHRWDGTRLTVQNADGSWPESGVDLKGEKGDAGEVILSDAVDSESRKTAASSLAVKTAYDAASAAGEAADAAGEAAGEAKATAEAAETAAAAATQKADVALAALPRLDTLEAKFEESGKVKAEHLPPATTSAPGVVQIGSGLKVTENGLLSADNTSVTAAGALTLHVRQDGNDLNSGLEDSASGALKTPQAALEKALSLDMRQYQLTISLGTGTWDASGLALPNLGRVALPPIFTGQGAGTVLKVSGGSGEHFTNRPESWWQIKNLAFVLSGDVRVQNISGYMDLRNVSFTGTTSCPMLFWGNGAAGTIANCSFSGTAACCINTNSGGQIVMTGDIAVAGTYTHIINILNGGFAVSAGSGARFTGSPSGTRYNVARGGVLDTNGGGANFICGTKAGTANATNGGYYV